MVFRLDAGFHSIAQFHCGTQYALEHVARCLFDGCSIHHQVACDPGNLLFPGQLRDARCIRHSEHIGMRRCHIQICGEARKSGTVLFHARSGRGGNELGALHPSQIGKVEKEVLDALFLCEGFQLAGHVLFLSCHAFQFTPIPGSSQCPQVALWPSQPLRL